MLKLWFLEPFIACKGGLLAEPSRALRSMLKPKLSVASLTYVLNYLKQTLVLSVMGRERERLEL